MECVLETICLYKVLQISQCPVIVYSYADLSQYFPNSGSTVGVPPILPICLPKYEASDGLQLAAMTTR